MLEIVFLKKAAEDFDFWLNTDSKISRKIYKLILECSKTAFTGTGKPEALKYELSGKWSRRITDADRLIYEVSENKLIIISCKGHYS